MAFRGGAHTLPAHEIDRGVNNMLIFNDTKKNLEPHGTPGIYGSGMEY